MSASHSAQSKGKQQPPLIEEKIANQKVSKEEYQQQVDRWNRFNELLDSVQRQAQLQNFQFHRNMKTSYSERRKKNFLQGIGIGPLVVTAYIAWIAYVQTIAYKPRNMYDILNEPQDNHDILVWSSAIVGVFGTMSAMAILSIVGKLPENIQFSCKPTLFIDDLFYLRGSSTVKPTKKRSQVPLPELTMELPQSWIKQQSLLTGMEAMVDQKGVE